eukprot:5600817-Amphidinium_carterae.1
MGLELDSPSVEPILMKLVSPCQTHSCTLVVALGVEGFCGVAGGRKGQSGMEEVSRSCFGW